MILQEQLTDWENLWLAYHNAARGKRGRQTTAAFELLLADNLLALQAELEAHTYRPGEYCSFYIHEPKRRLISAAPFRDRVVHHALCHLTTPYFESRFIPESFANRIGKGTHRALDCCQRYARRFQYVLQCDVVQFFPSIDHAILRTELDKMLPDGSLGWLIDRILESGRGVLAEQYQMVYFPQDAPTKDAGQGLFAALRPRGLPIGNLTSQWWANIYLNGFDHFVKRELGCRGYLRYVDDFLLFSDSKAELWRWREALVRRLERYRLTIHSETALPRPVWTGIPFLGFAIYPEYRLLKKRKGIAYQRRLKQLLRTASPERIQASLQGWINHVRYADSYGLRKAILNQYRLLAGGYDG
jgi:retron-type reverse transcriptase